MRRTLVLTLCLAACGGRYRASDPAGTGGGSGATGTTGTAAPAPDVEHAALPFAIVDGHTGRAVTEAALYEALGKARGICIGEDHPNPHHHWAQLTIVSGVIERAAGLRLALGLEMVQAPFQGVLDDWGAAMIDDAAFLSRTGWRDRWGYDFALYRPILERARAAKLPILALNAPRELVKAVSKKGLAGLTAEETAKLPALVLDDRQHRAWFDGVMGDLEGHGNREQIYAAQVVWDESMAERARAWLASAAGDATVMILAGNGHCHDSAIVRRLVRRGGAPTLSIRPIVDDGEGNVAAALAEAHHDYLFIMRAP